MPVSCEVKRTLVKSPPELWSELSDAESLARHLDGLGELRITKTEPEAAVEWEATGASGSVRLEPSGFGTKVTLSLSRETVEPGAAAKPEAVVEPEKVGDERPLTEPMPDLDPAGPAVPESMADQQSADAEPEPSAEPRQGFFARLFRRRRKEPAVSEPSPGTAAELACELEPEEQAARIESESDTVVGPEPEALTGTEHEAIVEPEPEAVIEPEPDAAVEPEPETTQPMPQTDESADPAADLATLEARMAEQDEAMLTAILDRLGAAHHRPFSRS